MLLISFKKTIACQSFKTILSSIILIAICSTLVFGNIAYAENDAVLSAEYARERAGTASADPTVQYFTPESTPSTVVLESVDGAVLGCVGRIMNGMFGQWIKDGVAFIASSLAGSAIELTGIGAILSLEVPVKEEEYRKKEVGTKAGPVTILPGWDSIGYCILNLIIEVILTSTTEWVKSGFNGNPAFIDNPEKFFEKIADYEAGAFLDAISNGFLCSPWEIEIKLALLRRYTERSIQSCTLTEVIKNVENFVNEDFNEGGWKGWFMLTQESRNNPVLSLIESEIQLKNQIAGRKGVVSMEVGWSNGFLSTTDALGNVVTPGKLMVSNIETNLAIPAGRITFADEFDELLDALINQVLLRTVGEVLNPGSSGSSGLEFGDIPFIPSGNPVAPIIPNPF